MNEMWAGVLVSCEFWSGFAVGAAALAGALAVVAGTGERQDGGPPSAKVDKTIGWTEVELVGAKRASVAESLECPPPGSRKPRTRKPRAKQSITRRRAIKGSSR
jgi:hypothetical protein